MEDSEEIQVVIQDQKTRSEDQDQKTISESEGMKHNDDLEIVFPTEEDKQFFSTHLLI